MAPDHEVSAIDDLTLRDEADIWPLSSTKSVSQSPVEVAGSLSVGGKITHLGSRSGIPSHSSLDALFKFCIFFKYDMHQALATHRFVHRADQVATLRLDGQRW